MEFFTDRYGDPKYGTIVGTVLLTLFGTVGGCVSCKSHFNDVEYSEGTRVGVINKFTNKGFWWKTFEGEMALEGIVSSGGNSGANVWDFSLDGDARHGENIPELAKKVQEYADQSRKVKVTYVQPWTSWFWRGDTDYFLQTVEPVTTEK